MLPSKVDNSNVGKFRPGKVGQPPCSKHRHAKVTQNVTPAYTWDLKATDDGGYIKAFTGYSINASTSLDIEGQYNVDVRDALLQDVIRGEKWRLLLLWENYF